MRTNRSLLSFGSTILFTAVTILIAFVTTPLLLGWLGAPRCGAYRMLVDWSGYLMLLDLTLGGALGPLLARALAQGDERAIRGTIASGVRAYLGLTVVVVVGALAATPLIARQGGPALADDLALAWVVLVLGFLPMAMAPFRALAEAGQRGYWINLLLVGQSLLITGLALTLAWAGWGVTGQTLATAVGTTATLGVLGWVGIRRIPGLLGRGLLERGDPGIARSLRAMGLPTLLLLVSGRIGLLSDNLIVGNLLTPAVAFSLYVTQRLAVLAQGQLQAIGMVSWAALAELHARGERETFNRRLVELTGLVAVLGVAVLGPIAAYGRHFFNFWIGGNGRLVAFAGEPVILVASANALLLSLTSLWGWCLHGTGQMRLQIAPALLATTINLAASLLLTRWLGPVGALLGTLVATVSISIWWEPWLLRRCFGTSRRALALALARPLAWGVPYSAGLWWIAHAHRPWGWPGLAAEMGAATAGFLALGYLAILSPTDRDLWRLRLAGFVGMLSGAFGPRSRGPRPPTPAGVA